MVSRALISLIQRGLIGNGSSYYAPGYYATYLTDNGFYEAFIVCNITDKRLVESREDSSYVSQVEVPVFATRPIISTVDKARAKFQRFNTRRDRAVFIEEFDTITIPMYKHPDFYASIPELKTGDAILKHIFSGNIAEKYMPFKLVDGTLFYGNKGMLMDSDGNLLVYSTLTFELNDLYTHILYNTVYINPLAFTNKDLVSKTIITKLLPILMSDELNGYNIKYIIEDKTSVIQRTIEPTADIPSLQLDLNTVIAENAELIMDPFM